MASHSTSSAASSRMQDRPVRAKVIKKSKPPIPLNLSVADQEWEQQKFIRLVRENSSKMTEQERNPYKGVELNNPNLEVNPVLKEVDFYAGEIDIDQQYKKEDAFDTSVKKTCEDQTLTLRSLEESLYGKQDRHISLAGSAGSGKSTLMKRLVRNVLRRSRFKFVHFMNISSISDCDEVSLLELLFDNPALHNCRDLGYEWLIQNEEKAVLFFDGLDQSTWPFLQEGSSMGYYDASNTATVMYNLLNGHLFPNLTIVTSSREHVLTHFQGDLRPQRVIQLAGLVLDDRKKLFQALVGDADGKMWSNMISGSQSIVHFCTVPLISFYNAIIHKRDPNNIPRSMSSLLANILQIFFHSKHAVKRKENKEIVDKLKQLSYEVTKAKRVIFTESDLKTVDLDKNKVRDLIIEVPDSEFLNTHLLEGETRLFFSHQCLQEFLAALCISEMDTEDFGKEVRGRLHNNYWSVVRRFVCGYLLNQQTRKALGQLAKHQTNSNKLEKKQEILKQSLKGKLKSVRQQQKLELFASLSESEDLKFVQSVVMVIRFFEFIGANGMHALSSVVSRCKQVNELIFWFDCRLTAEHLGILSRNLEFSDVKVNMESQQNQESIKKYQDFAG